MMPIIPPHHQSNRMRDLLIVVGVSLISIAGPLTFLISAMLR